MKFRCKKFQHPQLGDLRLVVKFALLPKYISDDTIVWLEKYNSYQEYKFCYVSECIKWIEYRRGFYIGPE